MNPRPLAIDAGLLSRFRAAGAQIQWRPSPSPAGGGRSGVVARIAHLHDEEARVETSGRGTTATIVVDSGPVGALVLLLEFDRRGPAARVTAVAAGGHRGFDQGAIEARWGPQVAPADGGLPLADLVELARYALA